MWHLSIAIVVIFYYLIIWCIWTIAWKILFSLIHNLDVDTQQFRFSLHTLHLGFMFQHHWTYYYTILLWIQLILNMIFVVLIIENKSDVANNKTMPFHINTAIQIMSTTLLLPWLSKRCNNYIYPMQIMLPEDFPVYLDQIAI